MARYTGLSTEYVLRCDLRPEPFRYFKELLRHRGQTVGRLDTRFLGHDRDDAGEHPESDPMLANLIGAYAAGINRVLRDTLKYEADAPYVVHAPIWDKWTWKDFANKYVNVGDSLRRAMQANPHMRVYVASGYYDLGTPHAAGDYTLSHLGLRPHMQKNVQVSYFESGHMMYIHRPSLERMAAELKAFVAPRPSKRPESAMSDAATVGRGESVRQLRRAGRGAPIARTAGRRPTSACRRCGSSCAKRRAAWSPSTDGCGARCAHCSRSPDSSRTNTFAAAADSTCGRRGSFSRRR